MAAYLVVNLPSIDGVGEDILAGGAGGGSGRGRW